MPDVRTASYETLGTGGNASKIKPMSLEAMYQRYLRGELSAKVNRQKSPQLGATGETMGLFGGTGLDTGYSKLAWLRVVYGVRRKMT